MRFKNLVQEVKEIASREDISRQEASRVEALLSDVGNELADDERRTIAQLFWSSATSSKWSGLLAQHIRDCPDIVFTDTGYQVPPWVALPYVKREIGKRSEKMLDLLLSIETKNPRFFEVIAEAALHYESNEVKKIFPLLIQYAKSPYAFSKQELADTLPRLAAFGLVSEAMTLCHEIVSFRRDPAAEEKTARREADPTDWTTTLEPSPKLDDWEYQEILVKGVRPLAELAPLQTAKMLITVVLDMIRLKETPRDKNVSPTSDSSEVWCGRVDRADRAYLEPKAALVHTLTYACEKVYDAGGQNRAALDELDADLRAAKYLVFDRIRFHLYSRHPSETVNWIREAILGYSDFAESPYGFEFQQMIRRGCEKIGSDLLTQSQRKAIFDQILSGPDKQRYKEWLGVHFKEDLYTQRQRYFWLTQLTPFTPVLFGEYETLYNELASERPPPTDDDYSPFSVGESKTGASRGSISTQDLLDKSDDDLVAYLNEWEDPHRDEKQWWIDIDFSGLGRNFGQAVQGEPQRFLRWGERWQQIERPIYFRYALEAANKIIKEGQKDELNEWLRLCEWIVAQKDAVPPSDANVETSETSRTQPDWNLARRAVVDLIETCVSKEVDISIDWQSQLYNLLRAVCTSADRYLDANKAIITPRDYLTDAINTTRGRALENLISYGWWARRRQGEQYSAPDVFQILETRFDDKPPLSIPEHTLLAVSFGRLYGLDSQWMEQHVRQFFPRGNHEIWKSAFGGFLNFHQPFRRWFDSIEPEFDFALENADLSEEGKSRASLANNLGWHLLIHNLWGQFDSRRDLLAVFYTRTEPKQWAALFDQTGRSLKATQTISPDLLNRFKEFFETRLRVGNEEELKEFTFWLEAECLEGEWRLRALLRLLDKTEGRVRSASVLVERLRKLADNLPDLVVECFTKLTRGASKQQHFYLSPEPAKAILNIGLVSNNSTTVENAEEAQDNLLKMGYLEYLDLEGSTK